MSARTRQTISSACGSAMKIHWLCPWELITRGSKEVKYGEIGGGGGGRGGGATELSRSPCLHKFRRLPHASEPDLRQCLQCRKSQPALNTEYVLGIYRDTHKSTKTPSPFLLSCVNPIFSFPLCTLWPPNFSHILFGQLYSCVTPQSSTFMRDPGGFVSLLLRP